MHETKLHFIFGVEGVGFEVVEVGWGVADGDADALAFCLDA